MKKLYIFTIIFTCLFFSSCQNIISYQLRNNTDYDVILIDTKHVNYPAYYLKAHTWIAIDHTTAGNFILFNNSNPIEVINNYTFSVITELNSYNIKIKNNTATSYRLNVLNSSHVSTNTFSITSNQNNEIKIYARSKPILELLNDEKKYNNFILNDDTLVIY